MADKIRRGETMLAKKDGNGSITINKSFLSFATFMIILATALITLISFGVGVKADVMHNKEQLIDCTDKIQTVSEKAIITENKVTEVETNINNIKENIQEIKELLKEEREK